MATTVAAMSGVNVDVLGISVGVVVAVGIGISVTVAVGLWVKVAVAAGEVRLVVEAGVNGPSGFDNGRHPAISQANAMITRSKCCFIGFS